MRGRLVRALLACLASCALHAAESAEAALPDRADWEEHVRFQTAFPYRRLDGGEAAYTRFALGADGLLVMTGRNEPALPSEEEAAYPFEALAAYLSSRRTTYANVPQAGGEAAEAASSLLENSRSEAPSLAAPLALLVLLLAFAFATASPLLRGGGRGYRKKARNPLYRGLSQR